MHGAASGDERGDCSGDDGGGCGSCDGDSDNGGDNGDGQQPTSDEWLDLGVAVSLVRSQRTEAARAAAARVPREAAEAEARKADAARAAAARVAREASEAEARKANAARAAAARVAREASEAEAWKAEARTEVEEYVTGWGGDEVMAVLDDIHGTSGSTFTRNSRRLRPEYRLCGAELARAIEDTRNDM